jgi:hypothetical protein
MLRNTLSLIGVSVLKKYISFKVVYGYHYWLVVDCNVEYMVRMSLGLITIKLSPENKVDEYAQKQLFTMPINVSMWVLFLKFFPKSNHCHN